MSSPSKHQPVKFLGIVECNYPKKNILPPSVGLNDLLPFHQKNIVSGKGYHK